MKKTISLLLAALIVMSLAACGGPSIKDAVDAAVEEYREDNGGKDGGDDRHDGQTDKTGAEEGEEEGEAEGDGAPVREGTQFMLGKWDVYVAEYETVYDDYKKRDNFVITLEATNSGDGEAKFSDTANILAYQNGEVLDYGGAEDADGSPVSDFSQEKETVAPGGTITVIYAWQLEDLSTVTVNFGGYSTDIEDTVLTYDIEDMATEEWLAVMAEEEALANTRSFDMSVASGQLLDGWVIKYVTDDESCFTLEGSSGSITVKKQGYRDTPQDAYDFTAGSFPNAVGDEVVIGGITYLRLTVNENQTELYAAASDGTVFNISVKFVPFDEAVPQIEAFVIK